MKAKSTKKKSPTKKEIESANEALTTANQELQTRNDLLNEAYGYSEALFATIHEPMLVLDKNLRVKSANKTFYKIFKVKEKETEGVLLYDLGNGQWNIPRLRELLEDILPKNSHFYDFEITHTFQSIGEKIMLLNARRIIQKTNHEELILLAIADVTEQALARKKIEDSEKRFNMMLMQSPFAFALLKGKNRIIAFANDSLKETWGKGNNIEGKPLLQVLPELKGTPFPALIDEVYKTGIPYHANEVLAPKHIKGQKEDVYYNFVYQPYREADETISGVTIIASEVTASVIVKKALAAQHEVEKKALKLVEDSEKRYNMMLMRSPFGFAVFKGENMVITLANDSIKEIWGKGNDVEGKPLFDLLSELKNTAFPVLLDNVYTRGIPFHGEELLIPILRDEKLVDAYFNFVYQPYLEADETISGVTVIVYEVTAQALVKKALAEQRDIEQRALKSIEESNTRYHNLLLQTPVAIAIYRGSNYVAELANDLALQMLNKDKNLIGKPLFQSMPELESQLKPAFDNVMQSGIPFHATEFEATLLRNGKNEKAYFHTIFEPVREDDNTISGVIVVATEVTEQVLSRKKIEDSEKRYNMMLMQSPFAFAVLKGKAMVVTFANDSIKEMWGKGKEIEGKTLLEVLPEIKGKGFMELLDGVYTTGIPYTAHEIRSDLKRKGKMEEVYFNFVYQPYREADEIISGVTIIATEVTTEAIANKKIAAKEKQLQNIFKAAPASIAVLEGPALKYVLANADYQKLINRSEAQLLGKTLLEAFPELTGTGAYEIFENIFKTGEAFSAAEYPATMDKNNDGVLQQGYYKFVAQPIKDADGKFNSIMVLSIDITEQIEARKKIEDSDKRYNMMLMNSPFTFAVLKGKDLIIALANDRVKEVWGKGKDIDGKSLLAIMPELKDTPFSALLAEVRATGIPFHGVEVQSPPNVHGHTREEYFNFVFQPYMEADQTISGIAIIGNDVTEQVITKRKIEESEQRFRNLIYTSPSAIGILLGEDLVITIANEPIIEIWGKGKEIMGKKYFEALPELAEQGYKEVFNQVYKTGIPFNAIETPVSILQNGVTTLKYYNFILYPQKNIKGEINGIGIIATEVTSQAKYNLQIKASEERFRLLVMQAPVAICIVRGEDFIFEIINQEMANFLDRKIEDSLHKPLFDVIAEVKDQVYKGLLDNVYSTGNRFVSQELPLVINRNGRLEDVFVKFVYEPLREVDGTISGVMVLADEITDQVNARKAIEVSEKKFRLLTNNMPQKISNADAAGNIIFFNQQWIDDTGLTFEELSDWGWKKAMHPDDFELIVNNWTHSMKTGEVFDMECRIQNKEGEYRWHLSRAVPIKDEIGKIIMWVGSNTDIQEQKEQEERLLRAVAERTSELKQANEDLVKMNKELEAFTYVSSHDLQEPLRKIQIFAERILEKENPNLSDQGKNYFRLMQNAAQRMQTLIHDLLAFSRLSTADRKFENTDLSIIIDEVKKEFEEVITEKRAIIEVQQICEVHIIPFQFRQLMHNLIGNALKFSKPDRPPHIKISSVNTPYSKLNIANLAPQKEYCHITISDNGIGFEEKFSEKIFEVFQRLHGKDEYAGTGIGLAIVKKIVDNHNGIITTTGKLNEGATFDIYIPLSQKK